MCLRLRNLRNNLITGQEGQGLVEYALILILVSIAAIVTMGLLGTSVSELFSKVATNL